MKKIFLVLAFLAPLAISCSKEDDGAWRAKVQNASFLHHSVKHITDVIVHDLYGEIQYRPAVEQGVIAGIVAKVKTKREDLAC